MTKEEILKKYEREIEHWADEEYTYWDILKAMDEYGKQCFEAGRGGVIADKRFLYYETYKDYLKELENEKK